MFALQIPGSRFSELDLLGNQFHFGLLEVGKPQKAGHASDEVNRIFAHLRRELNLRPERVPSREAVARITSFWRAAERACAELLRRRSLAYWLCLTRYSSVLREAICREAVDRDALEADAGHDLAASLDRDVRLLVEALIVKEVCVIGRYR